MALSMEHAPTHHRSALPKRTSGAPATNAIASNAPAVPKKATVSPPRKRTTLDESNNSTQGNESAAGAAAGGSAGSGAGAGGRGGTEKDAREAGERDNRSGGGNGAVGGNGGGRTWKYSAQRKRVRVVDNKLGEFVVRLTLYEGDHNDICEVCDTGGDLLCCDFCNLVYHLRCVTPKLAELPHEEFWLCPACTIEVTARQANKRRRTEEGARAASPGPGSSRHQGQQQDKAPSFHGVKAEHDAFRSMILHKNQTLDIGLFPTAQAAARAYDRKALSIFGDAAVCNFPADEQVEVEGIGADGITVKGVVRSFHQWRAEMQWGNKKRHLGFFDRLDHAAYAYNRAALYMNGSDTVLNPIKEGYTPPPPTGAPVKVPRNKLFVQQLPLPLITLAQAHGASVSFEHQRRRQQMQGKYHSPLIGENHQVSCIPPLPPPTRPWAGRPLVPLAALAAALSSREIIDVSLSSDEATLPSSQSSGDEGATTLCVSSPKPRPVLDGGVCGTDHRLVVATTTTPHRALDEADAPPARDVGVGKMNERIEGKPEAMAEREVVDLTTSCSSPVLSPQPPPPPPPPPLPLIPASDTRPELNGRIAAEVGASGSSQDVSTLSTRTNSSTVRAVSLFVGSLSLKAVLPEKDVVAFAEGGSSRGQSGEEESFVGRGDASVEEIVEGASAMPSTALVASAIQRDDGGKVAIGATLERSVACPCPSTDAWAGAASAGPRLGQCYVAAGERKATPSKFSAWMPLSFRGGQSREGNKGCAALNRTSPTGGDAAVPACNSSSLLLPPPPPVYQPSPHLDCLSMQISPPPILLPASLPPASPHSTTAGAGPVSLEGGVVWAGHSVTPAASMKTRAIPIGNGRKRSLPSVPAEFATLVQVGGGDGGGGGGGGDANFNEVCGGGNDNSGGGIISNSYKDDGALDLSFDDVAELVWDPRAGPKPRFVPEVGGAAGGAGAGGGEADRMTLARAMWDRDSALIERVAPAHAEKAMQVLQMHRHDVERAAQMLTVRHGVSVQGLSSVRTTRNSRAEQEAASKTATSDAPLPSGLAWRGALSSAYGSGGSASGGGAGSGAGTVVGWQSAAVASLPRGAGVKKTDAQGVTREEARLAGDAFMRYGRDLNAVTKVLEWKKSRVVEYYYCVWKFSPAYQVWKATRHQAGLPGVGSGASSSSGPSRGLASGGVMGAGSMNATSDGMRWRGSRLRTLKTPSSQ